VGNNCRPLKCGIAEVWLDICLSLVLARAPSCTYLELRAHFYDQKNAIVAMSGRKNKDSRSCLLGLEPVPRLASRDRRALSV